MRATISNPPIHQISCIRDSFETVKLLQAVDRLQRIDTHPRSLTHTYTPRNTQTYMGMQVLAKIMETAYYVKQIYFNMGYDRF